MNGTPAPEDATHSPSERRVLLLRGGRLLVLGGLLAFGVLPCPFALFFRVPCPGCGLTRATFRLVQGDLRGALEFHPLVFVLLPAVAVVGAVSAREYLRTGAFGTFGAGAGRGANGLLWAAFALLVGVWLARFFGAFGGPVDVG